MPHISPNLASTLNGRPSRVSFLRICLCVIFALPPLIAVGQPARSDVEVVAASPLKSPLLLTADRADWTYPQNAEVTFRITLDVAPYPPEGVPIQYRLGYEAFEGAMQEAVVPPSGLELRAGPHEKPGFVRCIVTANIEGKTLRQVATVGIAPEKITPTQTEPDDFDRFWDQQKAELAKIAPDPVVTPAPDLSTDTVEVFYVNLQNVGGWAGPSRFYGVLCVPKGDGPFPAVLNVPGAGVRPYRGNVRLAAEGVITLQVGIHGIRVNHDKEIYDQLYRGALSSYNRFNLDDRQNYYFRRVYLGCLRALDHLASHPKWDGKNLLVGGGSQGGQLAIVVTALDSRVTGLSALFPAYCDVSGYLHDRAGGWPGLFRMGRSGRRGDQPVEPKLETTKYYDTVNFARRLRVPGFYSWGYNDDTCPPTSMHAAFNVISAPRTLFIVPSQGHTSSAEQTERSREWTLARLGLR